MIAAERKGCIPVANIKSQIKRNRQNEVRRVRNRSVRSEMRTLLKAAKESGSSEDTVAAIKKIDKAAAKVLYTQIKRPARRPDFRKI